MLWAGISVLLVCERCLGRDKLVLGVLRNKGRKRDPDQVLE